MTVEDANKVGSLFTDTDLRLLIDSPVNDASLLIAPFDEVSLTPAGYDLRVGKTSTSKRTGQSSTASEGQSHRIGAYDTCLVETFESIGMPKDRALTGMIVSTVTMVSRGLSHISTSVDADWSGRLLIVVHNHTSSPVTLTVGERFCTLMLFANRSPSTKSCGVFDGRDDIFRKQFVKEGQRGKRTRLALRWVQALIIPFAVLLGWVIFGNDSGMSAVVTAGVAVFAFLNSFFPSR